MNIFKLMESETFKSFLKHKLSCFFGYHKKDYACLICGFRCRCGNKHAAIYRHVKRGMGVDFETLTN